MLPPGARAGWSRPDGRAGSHCVAHNRQTACLTGARQNNVRLRTNRSSVIATGTRAAHRGKHFRDVLVCRPIQAAADGKDARRMVSYQSYPPSPALRGSRSFPPPPGYPTAVTTGASACNHQPKSTNVRRLDKSPRHQRVSLRSGLGKRSTRTCRGACSGGSSPTRPLEGCSLPP